MPFAICFASSSIRRTMFLISSRDLLAAWTNEMPFRELFIAMFMPRSWLLSLEAKESPAALSAERFIRTPDDKRSNERCMEASDDRWYSEAIRAP